MQTNVTGSPLNQVHFEREAILREIFAAIPDVYGLELFHFSDESSFRSERCVIRFGWERYEAKTSSTQFFDPAVSVDSGGMSLWLLAQILGMDGKVREGENPHYSLGREIVEYCDDLLRGDFSIRDKYNKYKNRILKHIMDVEALPKDHPTRKLYDENDLRWLDYFEQNDASSKTDKL